MLRPPGLAPPTSRLRSPLLFPLPLKHLEFWNRGTLRSAPPAPSPSLTVSPYSPVPQPSSSSTRANSTLQVPPGPHFLLKSLMLEIPGIPSTWPDITHCSVSTCPHSLPQLWEVTALSLSVVYPEHMPGSYSLKKCTAECENEFILPGPDQVHTRHFLSPSCVPGWVQACRLLRHAVWRGLPRKERSR